ncbi:MAG: PucR family transcriptional regulator [Oscillospiraceae bacterium]|nr:PucR family transcriptional regulator [Oscillospiraceae bacterium]
MSVTLNDILSLPSLRRSTVLAGKEGLSKIITSISVLECSAPGAIYDELFTGAEFAGGEVIITAFAGIPTDVDTQLQLLKQFASVGEIGIILYYVGIIMPDVDERFLRLADSLAFPVICMPRNDFSLRYSEVICEVMDAIVRDQAGSTTFALDLLEQASQLDAHNRTMDSVLRLASDQLRVNLILTDANYRPLNIAAWPRNQKPPAETWIQRQTRTGQMPVLVETNPSIWGYREDMHFSPARKGFLFAFSETRKIDPSLWQQLLNGIQIAFNLWGQDHDRLDLSELLKAIIQDDPIRMRRLGNIYNLDVNALSDVWILHNLSGKDISPWVSPIRELSREYSDIAICEPYENNILLLPSGHVNLQESEAWAGALAAYCKEKELPLVLTRCTSLKRTSDVKTAYTDNQAYIRDAMMIFPKRRYFTLQEVAFAKQCRLLAEQGAETVSALMEPLEPILSWRDGKEVIKTLGVYLLDKNSSITETAAELFVHKNTVKYRLQKAGDYLGFHIGDMPHSQNLMNALAIRRILEN